MRDPLKDYDIRFVGLKAGAHEFSYLIDSSFFALFDNALIGEGKLQAEAHLDKSETEMTVNLTLKGALTLSCDRCLEKLEFPVHVTENLLVKFGDPDNSTDEILYLPDTSISFNMAQFIYELASLQVPLRVVCGENSIPDCGQQFDHYQEESAPEPEEEESDFIDPRWDALKKLKS